MSEQKKTEQKKTAVKKIILIIEGKEISLNIEAARELKCVLEELFGKDKEIIHEHHWWNHWMSSPSIQPQYPIWTYGASTGGDSGVGVPTTGGDSGSGVDIFATNDTICLSLADGIESNTNMDLNYTLIK